MSAAEASCSTGELGSLPDSSTDHVAASSSRDAEIWRDLALNELHGEQRKVRELQNELFALKASRTYRLSLALQRSALAIAPIGSWQRRTLGAVARRLIHLRGELRLSMARRNRGALRVPRSETPEVSIVIPAHGHWGYTERCLASIAQHSDGVELEVILVDDASPDSALAKARQVEGLRVVALTTNVGFTRAANRGMAEARGRHILLLNNDTEVLAGWLRPLIETMGDERVGLVGSKLIYPDGRLQEAGGVIFSDGSGWNYGRLDDPGKPQYNHRREVDYCSGASILVSRKLYEATGGFDERYAPAYYEDTDLAFEARRLGMTVVFDPRSVVIHHEGVSNGRDEAEGTKAFQATNRRKFVEKWKDTLTAHHLDRSLGGDGLASMRSPRGAIVVLDHIVPRWREDSGSLRMYGFLTTLVSLGYDVILLPDAHDDDDGYTSELREAGVLVWTRQQGAWEYLLAARPKLVCGVVSRLSTAMSSFLKFRQLLGTVPLVFDTVDLHFLREERGAVVQGVDVNIARVRTLKELELAFIRAADTTIVVSEFERDLLQSVANESRVVVVSNVHAPSAPATPEGRHDITFVGSFEHAPNRDAVQWFIDQIFPLIRRDTPHARVMIVGKNPPREVVEAAPKGVTFVGWVENLDEIHRSTRVSVAPLRYGAGVKGKVGDAWAHGVPVVMTSVAAEGMRVATNETAFVADDPQAFAEAVGLLLNDDEVWQRMSTACQKHVASTLGPEAFTRSVETLLEVTVGASAS